MSVTLHDQGTEDGRFSVSFKRVDDYIMAESLRYIPRSVVDTWAQREYLVVFGIPSVDLEARRRRRYLQRTTCWRFPGVATKSNNFTGEMLVLYVLARHPSHGYNYSAGVQEEASEWHDLLTLYLGEGRVTTNKTVGGHGFWGIEAEVGMSRKTFMWFHHAVQLFPNASYLAKGDDDMFLRVPQYLADLRTLPRHGLYWGLLREKRGFREGGRVLFRYITGFCATLGRDVAEHVVSYEPLRRTVYRPQNADPMQFYYLTMDHEDMMVGRALYDMQYPVVFAREQTCSFHDLHEGFQVEPLTSNSVVIHHLWESEYAEMMERFGNDTSPSPRKFRRPSRCFIGFPCNT
ncbi:UDP-Gal or UDP-GlcNAc-dependent glycosyltransferase [Trypanosoma theileri]|uniref:Hexosyltransferase n=1 Tax=Trypanosoma theileri TaxID=67003 RepID=A0A1X0NF19_9TRYP|nr:UDP-Gal or UDP-GlcNAc-dependent glycosyltransferase [Trypanosoma theileri]ORC80251.1 UDP-Gal or UDP-GlcNAc-dependent glycosyltransferase [Trypanosoma theileri]